MSTRCLAIIPAYNEEESIGRVLAEIAALQPPVAAVVVDDGSQDATAAVARAAGATVLQLPVNLGIGGAVQTGYRYARERGFEIAIQVDGDGQHIPAEIAQLIAPILDGRADTAVGTRFHAEGTYRAPFFRRVGIRMFAALVSGIVRERVTDTTSGFRAVNRAGILLFAADYPQDYPEVETRALMHKAGLVAVEVPVQMRERAGGESSITPVRSAYYVVKVTLALLVGLFRRSPRIPLDDAGVAG